MKRMNKEDRIKAAIAGERVDRIPISLWQHFPWADQNPRELARTQLAFQKKFDFDFIKVMPYGLYSIADYNLARIKVFGGFEPPVVEEYGIDRTEEWAKLPELDPESGELGHQLQNLSHLNEGLKGEVPFIQTIFSPLTTLSKLGGPRLLSDIKEDPDVIHTALESVCRSTINFVEACIETGVSGFFFATQNATKERMSEADYREFGLEYDLQILRLMAEKTWFNIFHFHGTDIMTELIPELPIKCISWHDRRTFPSLSEAQNLFPDKCLVGGINEKKTIMDGTLQEITEETYEAIEQTGGKRLIVAPGCVAPTRTPHMNYYAARMAVETYQTSIEVDFIA